MPKPATVKALLRDHLEDIFDAAKLICVIFVLPPLLTAAGTAFIEIVR